MIELARLRIFPSGQGFDLKFHNPSPNLIETFSNALFVNQSSFGRIFYHGIFP